jgi:hypothetical protein
MSSRPERRLLILVSHCLLLGLACANSTGVDLRDPAGREVGFEEITIPDLEEPSLNGGVWYPAGRHADGGRLPLIVFSHGGGGSYDGHAGTAFALARAGFVVAALNHAGDAHDDQSRVLDLWTARPRTGCAGSGYQSSSGAALSTAISLRHGTKTQWLRISLKRLSSIASPTPATLTFCRHAVRP